MASSQRSCAAKSRLSGSLDWGGYCWRAGAAAACAGGRQAAAGVAKIAMLMLYLRSSELQVELRRAKEALSRSLRDDGLSDLPACFATIVPSKTHFKALVLLPGFAPGQLAGQCGQMQGDLKSAVLLASMAKSEPSANTRCRSEAPERWRL